MDRLENLKNIIMYLMADKGTGRFEFLTSTFPKELAGCESGYAFEEAGEMVWKVESEEA